MLERISAWVMGKEYRVRMVISMIGFKGQNTIEIGDYYSMEDARRDGAVAMKALLKKMPIITVVEDVIIENLRTGHEVSIHGRESNSI